VKHAGELAAVGPADAVRKQLQRYLDAGATDLVLSPVRSNSADPELLCRLRRLYCGVAAVDDEVGTVDHAAASEVQIHLGIS